MTRTVACVHTIEGNGPPLFLIHGIGAARDAWRFMVPRLAENFTVISYDLRGHGASPLPDGEFSLDDLVEDLEEVRRRTGFEQAHFAGHSLGGMIGPAYARKFPGRVLTVSLLSTAAGRTAQDSANVWAVVRAMENEGIANVLETLVERWFTGKFAAANPDIVKRRLNQVVETDPNVFLNVFRIYAGTEMRPWLHEIACPCLVLTGEHDGGCSPRLNRLIADALPDSELVVLKGLKHSILVEAGPAVADAISDFIARRHGKD